MPTPSITSSTNALVRFLLALAQSPQMEMLADIWKQIKKAWRGWTDEGMYEVLEYESTLELLDRRGERAIVHKREKVRYLQNNIIAYQDQAWGDGKILVNYRCTPGVPVDQYRPDQKTYILISLREVKQRGDENLFHIEWEAQGSFTRSTERWATDVNHRMHYLKLEVIFPASRPPLRAFIVEAKTQKTRPPEADSIRRLPDDRYIVMWETRHPRRYETYAIQWEW